MKAPDHRSSCAKTRLAKALCAALIFSTPAAQCLAAQLGASRAAAAQAAPAHLLALGLSTLHDAKPASAPLLAVPAAIAGQAPVSAAAIAAPSASAAALLTAGPALSRAKDGWSVRSALSRIFGEGRSPENAAQASRPEIQDENVKFYIAEQGRPTISGKLSELRTVLQQRPELAARLKIARLATAKPDQKNPHVGLQPEDAARVGAALGAQGVKAVLELERVPVDWQRHAERAQAAGSVAATTAAAAKAGSRGAIATVLRWATMPAREIVFLGRTYAGSVSAPTRQELIGAAATKIVPFVLGVGVWWKTIGPSHPVLLASAILLSGAWEAFHGVLLNSWNTFQNNLFKLRGGTYQTNFNWLYGQMNPAIFRLMSWSVDHNDPARVPPWKLSYWVAVGASPLSVAFWFAMAPISIFGTFIGTIAYRGLNTLYETGRLTRGWRSGIQQMRDLVMMVTGILLGAGMAKYYVYVFLAQQAFDIATYAVSLRAKGRPILYVVDEAVDATKEFHELYPVAPNPTTEPALKQALKALTDIPLLYPLTLPIKYAPKIARWISGRGRIK